jgi:fructose-bisphosphate aldolase class II
MQCQPWQPVEHLILYNGDGANAAQIDAQIATMMTHGQEVLSRIPGVRRVFAGSAIPHQAHYQYCWLVQLAHPKVIDSCQHHPEYVAFANQYLRPLAQDRITIDFAATGGAPGQGVGVPHGAPNRRTSTLGPVRQSGAHLDS